MQEIIRSLFESKILTEASKESVFQKWVQQFPPLNRDEFERIADADPTDPDNENYRGVYSTRAGAGHAGYFTDWLMSIYVKSVIPYAQQIASERGPQTANAYVGDWNGLVYNSQDNLYAFFLYFKSLPSDRLKNLSFYKSVESLIDTVKEYGLDRKFAERPAKSSQVSSGKEDKKDIYSDSYWYVVQPTSVYGAMYWGKNTWWCTSTRTKSANKFEKYNSIPDLNMYYILSQNGRENATIKFLYSDKTPDGDFECIDKKDFWIMPGDFFGEPKLRGLRDFMLSEGTLTQEILESNYIPHFRRNQPNQGKSTIFYNDLRGFFGDTQESVINNRNVIKRIFQS